MAAEFTRDQEFVARFKREGLISSKLRHPNIVQVYDYNASDGLYYIAMEYVGAEICRPICGPTEANCRWPRWCD